MINCAVFGGYHPHTCSLFQLFLLAGVIVGKLKRDHEFVIIDTANWKTTQPLFHRAGSRITWNLTQKSTWRLKLYKEGRAISRNSLKEMTLQVQEKGAKIFLFTATFIWFSPLIRQLTTDVCIGHRAGVTNSLNWKSYQWEAQRCKNFSLHLLVHVLSSTEKIYLHWHWCTQHFYAFHGTAGTGYWLWYWHLEIWGALSITSGDVPVNGLNLCLML